MAEPRLQARGLSVVRGRARTRVLDDVSFSVEAGTLLAILGPNGAGKSTLLKAAAGLLPFSGELRLGGQDAQALGRRARARLVAYVPQHSALEAALPVRDVVAQGRFAHREPLAATPPGASLADAQAIARALALTDATRLADRPFSALSYGERRLVLLARALATGAGLLLLDEPTAALDVHHALTLCAVLRRLASEGAAVVVVLHQLNEAASTCDRALLLAGGRCVAAGPVAEVIAAGPIRRVYDVDLLPGAHFGYRLPPEGNPEPREQEP
jgi:iron complex transport system ATP-binding protein